MRFEESRGATWRPADHGHCVSGLYSLNMEMPTASRNVCHRESTGFRTLMYLTSVLFHRKRMKNVNTITKIANTIRLYRASLRFRDIRISFILLLVEKKLIENNMTTVRKKSPTLKKRSPVSSSRRTPTTRRNSRSPNPWAPKYTWAPWGTKGVVHNNCYDYAFGSYSSNRTEKSVPGVRAKIGSNGLNFRSCNGIAERVLANNPGNVYKMKSGNEKPKKGFYKVMSFVAPTNDFGNSTGDFHWYKEISAIQYKIRRGDTVTGLAKFFHVTAKTILNALPKGRASTNTNNGRVANKNSDLHVLDKLSAASRNRQPLPVGRVIEFPVKLWSHKTGWAGGPLIVDASGKTITDPRKANRKYVPGFHYTKFCSAYGVRRGFAKTGNNANRIGVTR